MREQRNLHQQHANKHVDEIFAYTYTPLQSLIKYYYILWGIE